MGDWPLTGRDRELAAGADALRRSRSVVIAGGPGTGRTRLARELLDRAATAGNVTVSVTATAAARAVPLGALAPLLPGLAPGADLFTRAIAAVERRTVGSTMVALVDDAHLLDDVSAALVHQLAAHEVLTVVATVVTGAPAPDAVVALWKDGHAERIDLAPLDDESLGSLVDAVLPGGVDGATRRALVTTAAGSPMALREMLADALGSGALDAVEGPWRAPAPLAQAARVADLLADSLSDVTGAAREVLELLAIGGPLGVSLLEQLVAPVELEALEAAGLLTVERRGARLEADLVPGPCREVLRAQLPALRHRRLAGALAGAVESCGARRAEDLRNVVVWGLDAGSSVDPERLVIAARDAHRALDFDLALRLARAAWGSNRTAVTGHLLGHLLWLAGQHSEADAVLGEALLRAEDDEAVVHVTNTLASNRLRGLQDPVGAAAAFQRSAERLGDQRCRAVLDAHHAALEVLEGRVADALARAEPYLDPAEPWLFAEAAVAAAPALALAGRTADAAALAEHAFAVHSGLPRRPFAADDAGIHWVSLVTAKLLGGRLAEGEKLATAAYEASLAANSLNGQAWFALFLGSSAQLMGRMRTAGRWFCESAAAFERLGDTGLRRVAVAGSALAAAVAGSPDRTGGALGELEADGSVAVRLYETMAAQARAWVAFGHGQRAAARSILATAAGDDLANGRVAMAVQAVHDLSRLGEADSALELFGGIRRAEVDGELLPAMVDDVEARAISDPAALEDVAARFEKMGAVLFAAEATAGAASARAQRDESRRAAALARRAVELAGRCEGAVTPALVGVLAGTPSLTRREAELAGLAAKGLTNGGIAARLGVSVRTVENHLGRAYAKLGVTSRQELAGVLSGGERPSE